MPFDATLKGLLEESPADWAALAGLTAKNVEVIDADVSTFTGATDKVLRVRDRPEWILHVEFQCGPDASLPGRVHVYNAILEYRHDLPVQSVVVLLTPSAALSNLTGRYERRVGEQEPYRRFDYRIVRVWEVSPGALLSGGLGTLPLAPISRVTERELSSVIKEMKTRLSGRGEARAKDLWTATYLLMGLRYPLPLVDQLLREVVTMEESVTYQAILDRGAVRQAHTTLILQGRERFGNPTTDIRRVIEGITDLPYLQDLHVKLLRVSSWEDLLGLPEALPASRPRRRKPKT
jgi:predicted transposase YdaD